jgi:hypothetical protein
MTRPASAPPKHRRAASSIIMCTGPMSFNPDRVTSVLQITHRAGLDMTLVYGLVNQWPAGNNPLADDRRNSERFPVREPVGSP